MKPIFIYLSLLLALSVVFSACNKDPCDSTICLNGGACNDGTCICPEGFTGTNCQTAIENPCDGIVCLNGGACSNGTCICPDGFTGANCQTPISSNPCAGVTCLNGGVCVNGICDCPDGFTGANCQTQLTPSTVLITAIVVNSFPATANGAGWDLISGPELYVSINQGQTANNSGLTTSYYQDAQGSVTFSGLNWHLIAPSNYYAVALWDEDTADIDDFMAGIYFVPNSYSAGLPSTIQLNGTSNGMSVTLHVQWIF